LFLLRFLFLWRSKEKETKRNAVFAYRSAGKNSSTLLRNSLLSCALVFCPVLAAMRPLFNFSLGATIVPDCLIDGQKNARAWAELMCASI
jgi:hypothetical protein